MLIKEPLSVTRFMALALLSVLLGCSATKDAAAESIASIVFHGGKIYTVNERQPWASAIATFGLVSACDTATTISPLWFSQILETAVTILDCISIKDSPSGNLKREGFFWTFSQSFNFLKSDNFRPVHFPKSASINP